ncbi:MAG: lipoprotein-releasing ABC transporter permease subunit [bacterium]|nr:lipoprotein-releasing ABC transporter permease subunit [bacterium]
MRFEAFVAARYLRGKRKSRFISLITLISIAGVAVGIMALIVVMSVMSGFDEKLMGTIIGNHAHLQIVKSWNEPIEHPYELIEELEALCPEIVAASPFIEIKAVLKASGGRAVDYEPAFIYGVDIERETGVTQLADNLSRENGRQLGNGDLPEDNQIVLGYILAENIGVYIDNDVAVITPNESPSPRGRNFVQQKILTVSGISQAQFSDFDAAYAYVNIGTAEKIKRQRGVDGIHVKLTDPWLARTVGDRIREHLGYRTITWYESQQAFFEALVQEKVAMFIILMFIVLVAAFNITSTLIMIVMEKRRDIGILRTIGVSSGGVMRVFMLEGLYIGFGGTVLGLVGGTLFAHNLNIIAGSVARLLNLDVFNNVIYYFDHIPVSIIPRDVALIALSAFVLTFLSTLYPAWSASRLDPVDALRYE